jgi:hypothetical protein
MLTVNLIAVARRHFESRQQRAVCRVEQALDFFGAAACHGIKTNQRHCWVNELKLLSGLKFVPEPVRQFQDKF